MLLSSIFGESLLDEFFGYPHQRTHFQSHASQMMRTDVKDLGNVYEMTMNLPGIPVCAYEHCAAVWLRIGTV